MISCGETICPADGSLTGSLCILKGFLLVFCTVSQKTKPVLCTSVCNFPKCWSIFKILSPADSVVNLQQEIQSNLGRAEAPTLTAKNMPQSPHWLQRDAPHLPQSNTLIRRPTSLTTRNGIQIKSAVLPQYTLRTDRPIDRPTHGVGYRSVSRAANA